MYRFLAYMQRDMIRWSRAKLNIVSTLVLPAAWLIFVGLTLTTDFTDNYLDFITPSILVLTMLAAGMSGGSSLMFDKLLGYLNKFLSMPSPRESILLGKIAFITVRGLIQSVVILLVATAIGATIHPLVVYLEMLMVLLLFGILISAFGTTVALNMANHDTYAAVQAIVAMPLFFTSTALMPYESMPGWLRAFARLNPVSYAIDSLRDIMSGAIDPTPILVLILVTAIMLCICTYAFRKVTIH